MGAVRLLSALAEEVGQPDLAVIAGGDKIRLGSVIQPDATAKRPGRRSTTARCRFDDRCGTATERRRSLEARDGEPTAPARRSG
jgi:hypothetical protein